MTTYGSVCSGIEAATVAWHLLGWTPAWFAEIEPFSRALLKHHWPHVPNLGDMTRIAAWVRAGLVAAPDVLVGGTPCQSYSLAGLRAGLLDPRGQLTLSFGDLANAIDEQRLKGDECIVVWENVPGVLSDKTNAFGCFLALLSGEDCELVAPRGKWPNAGCVVGPQRTVAWRVMDAQYVGVAQRRRRVFVVASARKGFDPVAVLFEFDGVRRGTAPRRETREDVAGTLTSSFGRRGGQPDCASTHGYLHAVAYGGNNQSGPIDVATARITSGSSTGRLDFESETFLVQPVPGPLMANGKAAGSATQQDAEAGMSVPTMTSNGDAHSGFRDHHGLVATYAIQSGALRTNPNSGPDGVGVQEGIAYTLEARAEVQACMHHWGRYALPQGGRI